MRKLWQNVLFASSNMKTCNIIRKLIEYFKKKVLVKAMFTLNIFEILLLEGRSVLGPAQQGTGSKRVSFQSLLFYSDLIKICGFI